MKTSEEITYNRLKSLIVNNGLPQDKFLAQRKLAELVGTTIVTLRSSLRLLENDGLLENIPKWGVRIPVEDENSIRERYYVRELLEVGAIDKMLDMHDPASRGILEEKAAECDAVKLTGPESFKVFAQKHADLHLTIAKLSDNKFLYRELNRLNFRSMMLSNSKYGWGVHNESFANSHHRDFIKKIYAADRREALEVAREHIREGCSLELATLRKLNLNKKESAYNESTI
jgi:DNA-binding GntR family transcriptional regulator